MKNLFLAAAAAISLFFVAGCATSHQMTKANTRLDQVETALDATRKDLDAAKTGSGKQISDAQVGIRDLQAKVAKLENRPTVTAAPGLSTAQVEQIAKNEATKAAAEAFKAGKVTDASTLASKDDLAEVAKAIVANMEASKQAVPAPVPAAPVPVKFAGIINNWKNHPVIAGAYLRNGYHEQDDVLFQGFTGKTRWLADLKSANNDPAFHSWVDREIVKP